MTRGTRLLQLLVRSQRVDVARAAQLFAGEQAYMKKLENFEDSCRQQINSAEDGARALQKVRLDPNMLSNSNDYLNQLYNARDYWRSECVKQKDVVGDARQKLSEQQLQERNLLDKLQDRKKELLAELEKKQSAIIEDQYIGKYTENNGIDNG